jgi:hypothetical protein
MRYAPSAAYPNYSSCEGPDQFRQLTLRRRLWIQRDWDVLVLIFARVLALELARSLAGAQEG